MHDSWPIFFFWQMTKRTSGPLSTRSTSTSMSRRPRERSGASARTAGAEPASAVRTPSSTQHVHDNMPSSTVPGNEAWFDALTCNSKDVPISAAARSMALNIGEGPITRMVHDLVRLSLFTEYQRSPLRRDAIVKKGMLHGTDCSA